MKATKATRGRTAPAGERRDEILDAALHCFVARGFHGTAVPEIAKRAGIAAGSMYHYFPGKEALVNALYRKLKGDIAKRVFTAFPQGAPVRTQFATMWRELVDFALAQPKGFAFLELHHHRSYLDAESLAMENGLKEFGAVMVRAAQEQGTIKAGPTALLMELVFGAFVGMMRAHWEGRVELTPEVRDLAERACWDMIAAAPVADAPA
jgi:AcrR family transcriptional regulator